MFDRIKDVAKVGEISMENIATLCAVSRQTLYNWRDGEPTNRLIKDRAVKMIGLLEKTISLGYLPLVEKDLETSAKLAAVKRQLQKAIDK